METKPVTGASLGTIAYPYTEFMGVRLYAMGNSPTVRCMRTKMNNTRLIPVILRLDLPASRPG